MKADAVKRIMGAHNQRCVLKKDVMASVNAKTTTITEHNAIKPVLEPERITETKHINDTAMVKKCKYFPFALSKHFVKTNGNNAACTAAKPAGFSNVPVIGNAL